jgi:hypothetical protein
MECRKNPGPDTGQHIGVVHPVNSINYYRILETDWDGRGSYSDILTLKWSGDDHFFIVLNNPIINGMLQVRLNGNCSLLFYSGEGRLLWQKQVTKGTETIDISGYSKGAYFLKADHQIEKLIVH